MDRAGIAKTNLIQCGSSIQKIKVEEERIDGNAITKMKMTTKGPRQDKTDISEHHLQSSVFSLTKENIVSNRSSEKFNNYPKISNYKIDELLTLKDFIKRHGRTNHKPNPTTTEFMVKIIIREMVEFMSYFEGEEEPIMNPEKMKVSTENSNLIGFYHIKALKPKTTEADKEYQPPRNIASRMHCNSAKNDWSNESYKVWAVGIIIYEILTGHRPFLSKQLHTMTQKEIDTQINQACDILSQEAMELVSSCLNIEGQQLIMKDILKQDWFKK